MDRFDKTWLTALQNEKQMHYFTHQLKHPKRSTFFFNEYFHELFSSSKKIIDLGGGNGTVTQYFAKNFPDVDFVCADFSDELLDNGKVIAKNLGIKNLKFRKVDWFNLDAMQGEFDGVISLQTLSWLSNFEIPLKQIFTKINPKWIGISSMFYDGDISTKLEVIEHVADRYSYYNTYSLNQISKFCKCFDYKLASSKDFDIDIDIEAPHDKNTMSSYTIRVEDTEVKKEERLIKRLQISGPVLMNWKNILIEKN